jgi:hypothetical protein
MWFVTPSAQSSPADEWLDFVIEFADGLTGELTDGTPADWRQISVTDDDGNWAFDFERRTVAANADEWAGDLDFFMGWLAVAKPTVNAQWVAQYLTRVQTFYLFRCSLNALDSSLDLVNAIIDSLRHDDENVGGHSGLMYAEGEGWSNENGRHITWEFTDGATGLWWMAIRADDGWDGFQMELGDEGHRRAFKAGEVPAGVTCQHLRD